MPASEVGGDEMDTTQSDQTSVSDFGPSGPAASPFEDSGPGDVRGRPPGLADRQDSASYQRRPPSLVERQDSASNLQALAEAERDMLAGPPEGLPSLGGRRDSAEDMQFISATSPNAGAAILRSPRRGVAADPERTVSQADELPLPQLNLGSVHAAPSRHVMRTDSARQHDPLPGWPSGLAPLAVRSSLDTSPANATSPFDGQACWPKHQALSQVSSAGVQRFDSASDRHTAGPTAASAASPLGSSPRTRGEGAFSPTPASPPPQGGDIPLGRRDSALDSLSAARRLVLEDRAASREVGSPLSRASSLTQPQQLVPGADPGTSAAMQVGPSAWQPPAEAEQAWSQGPSNDAGPWGSVTEELAIRQDSALDPLAAARMTVLRDPAAGVVHEEPASVPGALTSTSHQLLKQPSGMDPLVQARWLVARDAELERTSPPLSSPLQAPQPSFAESSPAFLSQDPGPSAQPASWPASSSFTNLQDGIPDPSSLPGPSAPDLKPHRVHRGDSASETPLHSIDSLAQARALLRAEFPSMAPITAAGVTPLSRQASRVSPRDSSYEESSHPDSPLFAGSQNRHFSSALDMLQAVQRPGGAGPSV